jgi:hypothetical protein
MELTTEENDCERGIEQLDFDIPPAKVNLSHNFLHDSFELEEWRRRETPPSHPASKHLRITYLSLSLFV